MACNQDKNNFREQAFMVVAPFKKTEDEKKKENETKIKRHPSPMQILFFKRKNVSC